MGRSTKACVVPFALIYVNDVISPVNAVFIETDGDEENEFEDKRDIESNGWTFKFDIAHTYKNNKQSLYVDVAVKGDKEVMLVNQHEYSNVCEEDWAVFSVKKEDLEEFKKDFNITFDIDSDVALCQTL